MHIDLKYKFDSLSEYFEDNGLDFEFKEIPYGMRFSILGGGVQINLYHGKKGFSYVVQGKDTEAKLQMQEELHLLFNGGSGLGSDPKEFSRHYDFAYMGSDESGKGDSNFKTPRAILLEKDSKDERNILDINVKTDNPNTMLDASSPNKKVNASTNFQFSPG